MHRKEYLPRFVRILRLAGWLAQENSNRRNAVWPYIAEGMESRVVQCDKDDPVFTEGMKSMMKKSSLSDYITMGVLLVISLAGTGFSYIKWRSLDKSILSLDFIDMAAKSVEDAYSAVEQTELYRKLFFACGILTGILLLVCLVYTAIFFLRKRKQQEQNNTEPQ